MTEPEEIIDALRNRKKIALTAPDLAALMDTSRSRMYERLRSLEDDGLVASMKVASKGRIWYLPEDIDRLDPDYMGNVEQVVIPTYVDYVHKPVDQRGRVTIHVDYADKEVTVALMDPETMRKVDADDWNYDNPMQYHRAREVMTRTADDRGRITVPREYAGHKISLAVLEVHE